jgi:hypothetical protein
MGRDERTALNNTTLPTGMSHMTPKKVSLLLILSSTSIQTELGLFLIQIGIPKYLKEEKFSLRGNWRISTMMFAKQCGMFQTYM